MKEKSVKIVRGIAKVALLLCLVLLLGLGIYYTYRSVKFKPYKVRVSNVTDSAFTVSWITDEPMIGVVYYGEKDSFLPGPLAWIGKKRAVDDRDQSEAMSECVSKFNKKASKTRDENFTVDVSGFDCNNVRVIKKGQYYTHHITVQNLEAEKEYFFRVGNGYISYAKNSGVYNEREIKGIETFSTSTKVEFTDIPTPNPAYGVTETFYQDAESKFFMMDKNYDSLVFLSVKEAGGLEYPPISAVANQDGGWSMDLSNVRNQEGKVVGMEDKVLVFMPQAENLKSFVFQEFEANTVYYPLRLPGNSEEDAKKKASSRALQTSGVVKSAEAKTVNGTVGCYSSGSFGRNQFCGSCYEQYIVMSNGKKIVCGWEKADNQSKCGNLPPTCNVPEEPEEEEEEEDEKVCPATWGTWRVVPKTGGKGEECKEDTSKCKKSECTNLCFSQGHCATLVTPAQQPDEKVCPATWGTWRVVPKTGGKGEECKEDTSKCKKSECTNLCFSQGHCATLVTPAQPAPQPTPQPTPQPQQCYYFSTGGLAGPQCLPVVTPTGGCTGGNYSSGDASCGGKVGCYRFKYVSPYDKCEPIGCWELGIQMGNYGQCETSRKGWIDRINTVSVTVIDVLAAVRKVDHVVENGEVHMCCPYSKENNELVNSKNLRNIESCIPLLSEAAEKGLPQSLLSLSECGQVGGYNPSPRKFPFAALANNPSDSTILYLPEPGVHLVKFNTSTEGLPLLGGDNRRYVFYENRDGVDGYQHPVDIQNPKEFEDIIIPQSGIVLSVSKETTSKELSLKEGINIVSYDFIPVAANDQMKMSSSEFLELANKDGNNVSSISSFSAGKWNSGTSYDFSAREIKGAPFDLTVGKGYVVIAEQDVILTIPGLDVKTPVPIAFSSGWNLVGVHGYDTQYTAKSFINSINSIEGLKSNNVTYWPTSKGMYQGFQLSEGQEYGQDFPINKDLGYFVRINEFNPPTDTCKSINWQPGGDSNGKCN